jgi:hypothetical protein
MLLLLRRQLQSAAASAQTATECRDVLLLPSGKIQTLTNEDIFQNTPPQKCVFFH